MTKVSQGFVKLVIRIDVVCTVKEALEQADDVMSRNGLRKNTLSITNE